MQVYDKCLLKIAERYSAVQVCDATGVAQGTAARTKK